jgi:hypothetical protein
MPRIPTFTANLMHFFIMIAIVYLISLFVNLVHYIKLCNLCRNINYVPGVDNDSRPSLYRINLRNFHKRSIIFILVLAPTTAFWPLTFAVAIPMYLVFVCLQSLVSAEWKNIGMTRKQTYLPMLITFLISLPLGRLIGWLYMLLPDL